MKVTTCRVGSDRLRITSDGGIVLASVSGLLGLPECTGALSRIHEAARATGAAAALIDMRGAALALSTPEYADVLWIAVSDPARLRVAMVVGNGLMTLARAHETLMKRRGLAHRAFSSPEQAGRWLVRKQPRCETTQAPLR